MDKTGKCPNCHKDSLKPDAYRLWYVCFCGYQVSMEKLIADMGLFFKIFPPVYNKPLTSMLQSAE